MLISEKNELLRKIANYLIINTCDFNIPGLFEGKTGIAIFFAHYSRYTGDELYNDFAIEIINESFHDLNKNYPYSFANGLCGIGWGIEYLIQNNFMKGDANFILEDLDSCIMEREPIRIKDLSFEYGLSGIIYYIMYHVKSVNSNQTTIDPAYLSNLFLAFEQNKQKIQHTQSRIFDQIHTFFKTDISSLDNSKGFSLLEQLIEVDTKTMKEHVWDQFPLGIKDGISGLGIKLMM